MHFKLKFAPFLVFCSHVTHHSTVVKQPGHHIILKKYEAVHPTGNSEYYSSSDIFLLYHFGKGKWAVITVVPFIGFINT